MSPWVRLDDKFHSNPKVLLVGNRGAGLYARALSYCGDLLTDGFVPDGWVLAHGTRHLAAKIAAAGLWQRTDGGWQIPDYLSIGNPSRKKVEAKRESDRFRKDSTRNPGGVAAESPPPRPEPGQSQTPKPKNGHSLEHECEKILACCTLDATDSPQAAMVRLLAATASLPEGAVAKVRESCQARAGRIGVGYAVNALRGEACAV